MSLRSSLADRFWARHANPKSGWSRTAGYPLLLYAIYRRDWRLLTGAVAFAVLNPVLFSPPEDRDAWMTRVVLAERWWTDEREAGLFSLSYPNVLNLCNLPVSGYALLAAVRRRPVRTALAAGVSAALKFWYVAELVRRYDGEHDVEGSISVRDR